MSIFGMMRTSASGLAAQSSRLGTVSDNVANSNTHGYKRAYTEFSTIVLESGGAKYVPGSVETDVRYGISQQGGFDFTTSETDLAINGEGFFLVSDGGDATYLTRAGSFVKNSDGQLINAAGYQLMGYSLANGAPTITANGTAGLVPVDIASLALEATPSTLGTFYANLPADATVETDLPSNNALPVAYTAKSSLVAIDNGGSERRFDLYFTKTDDVTHAWELAVYDNADQDTSSTGPFPYANAALAVENLTFDPATRKLDIAGGSPSSFSIAVPNGSTLTVDLTQMSELSSDYQVLEATVNGNQASSVESIEFADDGTLYSIFGNGSRVASFRVPLATVTSPDNLTPETGNVYTVSADSGDLQIGFPTESRFGSLRSEALEKSTVDTAEELTSMIESQYAYVSNSKVFQTAAELLEVLVNLKR